MKFKIKCKQTRATSAGDINSLNLFVDPINTQTKHVSPFIVVHLVNVFAIAATFQEFTFIVKY